MKQSKQIFMQASAIAAMQQYLFIQKVNPNTHLHRCKSTYYKSLLVLFIAWLLPCKLFAEYDHRNRQVDSLENVLKNQTLKSTELLSAYLNLSWGYIESNSGKSMHYSCKGIELAEKSGKFHTASRLYCNLGVSYLAISKNDSAVFCYEKALQVLNRVKEEETKVMTESRIYGSIANVFSVEGKFHDAVLYYFKALKLFEETGLEENIAIAFGNIGETYLDMENYAHAETYFKKKEALSRRYDDSLNISHALDGLSRIYLQKRDYGRALEYASEAYLILSSHSEISDEKISNLLCLSEIYLDGYSDAGTAIKYAETAIQEAEILGEPLEVSRSLRCMSAIYLFRQEYDKAAQAAEKALAVDSTHFATKISLYEYLTIANMMLGNKLKSKNYFKRYNTLKTIYSNRQFQSSLLEMEVAYETEKKEIRISALEDEKRLMIWLSIAVAAVLLLALATFFFLWRWTVQKKRLAESQKELAQQQIKQLEQEKRLIATQAILDGEVQERTRLARDLHDGLGSILAAAKYNLIDIRKALVMESAEAERFDSSVSLLDDSMREMRRVAHHLMPESLSNAGLKQSIANFCNSIPIVKFSYYGDDTRPEPQLEVVIYRIIHELVSNALKHSGASHILVEIVRDADRIFLTVQDNGCGFETSAESQGMGLANIRNRVAAYNGNVDIHSVAGEGTEINVEFQLRITN